MLIALYGILFLIAICGLAYAAIVAASTLLTALLDIVMSSKQFSLH